VTTKIKVLLAKLGLDVHNRGIITVAKELGDAGMEIVYIGNCLPGEIVQTAIVIGGVFPPDDTIRLKEIGFDAVFTPGATRDEIVHSIEELVAKKRV
jgi:methylmalonyl-CoA mutase cobalamin-binding subunit